MKTCKNCQESKPYEKFSRRNNVGDGYNPWCKACHNEYARNRYANGDKTRVKANRRSSAEDKQTRLWAILSVSECANCGNKDPEVLEFDHRDGVDKRCNIAQMLWRYNWDTIQEELDKCDILCSNCHRKRTIKQLGLWRGRFRG